MSVWKRLAIAAILTCLLVCLATQGMFVTSAPKALSLLIEPFSLLLMPGLVVAVLSAGAHDFSPLTVVCVAAAFYFCFFFWVFSRWAKSTPIRTGRSR